jgi:hypothetical protein
MIEAGDIQEIDVVTSPVTLVDRSDEVLSDIGPLLQSQPAIKMLDHSVTFAGGGFQALTV